MLRSHLSQNRIRQLLYSQLSQYDYSEKELKRLIDLIVCIIKRPLPPNPNGIFSQFDPLCNLLLSSLEGDDPEIVEESFLRLYALLHMHEGVYTVKERARMDATGGYWAHAGGLSPILKAGDFIYPDTVSIDLGAGNGLQGLFLQLLYPHRQTIQVEISSYLVETGKKLQSWLAIPKDRVTWIVGDVCNQSLIGVDFIYLYRPVRPSTPDGFAFYKRLAEQLDTCSQPITIFSIADCLQNFLSSRFEIFFTNGHLTCFRKVR